MIQRIQSIYLLLAGLVIFALFLFPVAHNVYAGGVLTTIKVTGLYMYSGLNPEQHRMEAFTGLTIGTVIVGLLPFILIFLYKNRKQQIMYCYLYMLVIIGYSFWMVQTVKSVTGGLSLDTNNFGIGALFSSISIVLTILAVKAIQRDEKLIKSADRLR
jgi:FtsH-binding integral membrane protein